MLTYTPSNFFFHLVYCPGSNYMNTEARKSGPNITHYKVESVISHIKLFVFYRVLPAQGHLGKFFACLFVHAAISSFSVQLPWVAGISIYPQLGVLFSTIGQ